MDVSYPQRIVPVNTSRVIQFLEEQNRLSKSQKRTAAHILYTRIEMEKNTP